MKNTNDTLPRLRSRLAGANSALNGVRKLAALGADVQLDVVALTAEVRRLTAALVEAGNECPEPPAAPAPKGVAPAQKGVDSDSLNDTLRALSDASLHAREWV